MAITVWADGQSVAIPDADARWLVSELRAVIAGPLPDEYAAAAVHIEHALEDAPDEPIAFDEPERAAILKVLESHSKKAWLPDALVGLANAMLDEISHHRSP